MNTSENLIKEFGTQFPRLETVAPIYLNCADKDAIYKRAAKGDVPFPVFKLTNSNRAPWLVDVKYLAKYLDECSKSAMEKHQYTHSTPQAL